MSSLVATVKKIENFEQLNIVEFDFFGLKLKMMSLDLDASIHVGKKVVLGVKPTNIVLAKNLNGELSFSNQLVATIDCVDNGKLLSSITLRLNDVLFESIITQSSSQRMRLAQHDEVFMLIKASDISILEVLND